MRALLPILAALATHSAHAANESPQQPLERFNAALYQATLAMDNAAMLALWEDDGISLLPMTEPIRGRSAIRALFESVTRDAPHAHMLKFELQCHDIVIMGDWAHEWCDEHQIVELGNDKPNFEGWGKMLLILHRGKDQQWRLQREMWNQSTPKGGSTQTGQN